MYQLWPAPAPAAGPLSDDELAKIYAYPERLDRPHLRMNFVASVDGAATLNGVSGGLSSPSDRRVFSLLRSWLR